MPIGSFGFWQDRSTQNEAGSGLTETPTLDLGELWQNSEVEGSMIPGAIGHDTVPWTNSNVWSSPNSYLSAAWMIISRKKI
jgi:hypothetical protein